MRELFILIAHLLITLAKLARPGGVGAVAAESLAVKDELLVRKRAQRRAPNLTSWDRLVLGVCALLVSLQRLSKVAVLSLFAGSSHGLQGPPQFPSARVIETVVASIPSNESPPITGSQGGKRCIRFVTGIGPIWPIRAWVQLHTT
jgi:hypothetical protein